MKRFGILNVTHELLENLLALPQNHTVVNIFQDTDTLEGVFNVVVRGPYMPMVSEGGAIPTVDYAELKEKESLLFHMPECYTL